MKPNCNLVDLVRIYSQRDTFAKSNTTIWRFDIYTNSEVTDCTLQTYRLRNLQGRRIEASPKKSDLTMNENEDFLKKLNPVYH